MFGLSMPQMMLLLVVGVLLFGKRLPEVARSVGKVLVDLKKGISSFEDQLDLGNFHRETTPPPPPPVRPPQRVAPTGQKFEDTLPETPPPPASPIV